MSLDRTIRTGADSLSSDIVNCPAVATRGRLEQLFRGECWAPRMSGFGGARQESTLVRRRPSLQRRRAKACSLVAFVVLTNTEQEDVARREEVGGAEALQPLTFGWNKWLQRYASGLRGLGLRR